MVVSYLYYVCIMFTIMEFMSNVFKKMFANLGLGVYFLH